MNQIVANSLKILEDVQHFLENLSDESFNQAIITDEGEKSAGAYTSEILSHFLYFLKGHRKGYMFYRLQKLNSVFEMNRTASIFCIGRIRDEIERANLHKEIKISFVPKDELASSVTTKASSELQKLNDNFFRILADVKFFVQKNIQDFKLPAHFAEPAEVKFSARRRIIG